MSKKKKDKKKIFVRRQVGTAARTKANRNIRLNKEMMALEAENKKLTGVVDMGVREHKRLQSENKRLRKLLAQEVDDGRAEIDDIGVDAWIDKALKE